MKLLCNTPKAETFTHVWSDFKTDIKCYAGEVHNYTLSNVVTVEGKY